jgi:Uncharacterised nucleotidyltransferase
MSPVSTASERFRRLLNEAGARVAPKAPDPGLDLAGRFGLRRFFERQATGDTGLADNVWLERGAHLRKEARDLSAALTDAGVQHFFFKGIALLGRFYRLDDRRLDDVDLMVPLQQRNTALAVLHAHGYADLNDPNVWGPASRRPGATMYRLDPATGERDTRTPLMDLHWGLEPVTAVLPEEGLTIPSAVWAAIEMEQRLPVLPDEYHAALVLHHLVRHDLLHVRGLLDLALLWEALPRTGGTKLTELAHHLGVARALGLIGRVVVDDLMLFPLRGLRIGARDWRGRAALRRMRLADWLAWAAHHVAEAQRHVTVTRSLTWRRYLLADAPRAGQLMGEFFRPPPEYLHWRWPNARSDSQAWRMHVTTALRS